MAKLAAIVTKVHRVCAALFLLTIPFAAYASLKGMEESFLVYLPLPFLFVLILTGTYQLVAPWLRRRRAHSAA